MLFVKETLHVKGDGKKTAKPTMSTWELIKRPGVMRVLVVYNYVMLMAFTFTAVFPVAQYTPVKLGGLGFTAELIAACTALNGVSQAAWLLIVFPALHKRVGTSYVLYLCASVWPLLFIVGPVYNFLLRHGHTTIFWVTGPPIIVLASGVSMAFSRSPETHVSCFTNVYDSQRPTRAQRYISLTPNPWHTQCGCAGGAEWYSIRSPSTCDQYLRYWRQVPYPGWSAFLALPARSSIRLVWAAEAASCKGSGGCEAETVPRQCLMRFLADRAMTLLPLPLYPLTASRAKDNVHDPPRLIGSRQLSIWRMHLVSFFVFPSPSIVRLICFFLLDRAGSRLAARRLIVGRN